MTEKTADHVVLAVLTVDGFITAILGALFLPAYIGSVPFPISAVCTAVVNIALVYLAARVTDRNILTALPLVGWGLGFLLCMGQGPGGDIILAATWQTLVFLLLGLAPAGYALYRAELARVLAKRA